jgi:hypothetical protein
MIAICILGGNITGQGLIAGNTSYETQLCDDIKNDIFGWISRVEEINKIFKESISLIQKNGYWKSVPYDFKSILLQSIGYFATFKNDANIIL